MTGSGVNKNNSVGKTEDEASVTLKPLLNLIGNMRERVTDALKFYAFYHQNPVNQKIHTVCIPLLVWTTMVWLSSVSFPVTKNMTNLLVIGYCVGYSLYDLKMGAATAGIFSVFSYTADLFSKNVPHANSAALVLQGIAWAMQIYGHAKFEGNRPAFLNSLLQSVYIAPLFSLEEVCGCVFTASQ